MYPQRLYTRTRIHRAHGRDFVLKVKARSRGADPSLSAASARFVGSQEAPGPSGAAPAGGRAGGCSGSRRSPTGDPWAGAAGGWSRRGLEPPGAGAAARRPGIRGPGPPPALACDPSSRSAKEEMCACAARGCAPGSGRTPATFMSIRKYTDYSRTHKERTWKTQVKRILHRPHVSATWSVCGVFFSDKVKNCSDRMTEKYR